jgi:hypothetical protein
MPGKIQKRHRILKLEPRILNSEPRFLKITPIKKEELEVKKLTLTLLIGLSLVLCGSAAAAGDGPQARVLSQDSQAAPEALQEAWTAEQPDLNQSMILIADEHESCKMLCAHYDIKCCETSPTKMWAPTAL